VTILFHTAGPKTLNRAFIEEKGVVGRE
jgi:hypothetical protein